MRGKILILVFFILLAPNVGAQACNSNAVCEYNAFTFESGKTYNYFPPGSSQSHVLKVTYISPDKVKVDIDGEIEPVLSTGDHIEYSYIEPSFSFFVEDIDDSAKTITLNIGENAYYCISDEGQIPDCEATHRIKLSIDSFSPQAFLPSIWCDVSGTCFISWQNDQSGQGNVYTSFFSVGYASNGEFLQNPYYGYSGRKYTMPFNKNTKVSDISTSLGRVLHSWENQGTIVGVVSWGSGTLGLINVSSINSRQKVLGSTVFNPALNRFEVFWAEEVATGNFDIFTSLVNPINGKLEGVPYALYTPGISIEPEMVFDADRNVHVLTWVDKTQSTDGDISIKAYDKNLASISSDISISKQGSQKKPSTVKGDNKFLTIFDDGDDISGQFFELTYTTSMIGGSTITTFDGVTLLGQVFKVASSTDTETLGSNNKKLAYNPRVDEYVAVWTNQVPESSITVKRMDSSGNDIGKRVFVGYKNPSISYIKNADRYAVIAEYVGTQANPKPNTRVYVLFLDRSLKTPTGTHGLGNRYTAPTEAFTKSLESRDTSNVKVANGDNLLTNTVLTFTHTTLGPKLRIGVKPAAGPVDLSSVIIESSDSATVVRGLSGLQNVEQTHSLLLSNTNNNQGLFVCPAANKLSDVNESCLNKVELKTVPSSSGGLSADFTDGTKSTYIVNGLTNTGIGLIQLGIQSALTLSIQGNKSEETIKFTADYTKNSTSIVNASCSIMFTPTPNETFSMSETNGLHLYERIFTSGNYSATVECSKQGETTRLKTEVFTILSDGTGSLVTLNSPADRSTTTSNSIDFECSATDSENIKSIDLFTDRTGTWQLENSEGSLSFGKSRTSLFSLSFQRGEYKWNCKVTNEKGEVAFALTNFSFNVNSDTLPDCTVDDWTCNTDWQPSDVLCAAGSEQTRNCTLTNANCSNPVSVKPAVSKQCSIASCTEADYQCQDWLACSTEGKQTRSCTVKTGTTCTGGTLKTEERLCVVEESGNPWLLIIVIIVVIIAVIGGVFYYFHKKATKGDDEESLWEDEYGEEGGDYDEGEYPPDENPPEE